jgi:uncharacterized RDD family membrane protein YckC
MEDSKREVAGIGGRILALIFDGIVLWPPMLLLGKLLQTSRPTAILGAMAYGLFFPLYNILLLGRFGQTVGKKIVGIRVELIDGSPIDWKAAFLRYAVDLLFVFILIVSWIGVLSDSAVSAGSLAPMRFYTLLKPTNAFFIWANQIWTVWIWGDVIVALLNKRRRAVHDFIVGTCVVHTRAPEESVASPS